MLPSYLTYPCSFTRSTGTLSISGQNGEVLGILIFWAKKDVAAF